MSDSEQVIEAFNRFRRRAKRLYRIRVTVVWICVLLCVVLFFLLLFGHMTIWLCLLFFLLLYVARKAAPAKKFSNAPLDCDPRSPFVFSRSFSDKRLVVGSSRKPRDGPNVYSGASVIHEVDTQLGELGRSLLLGDEPQSDPWTVFDFVVIRDTDAHWAQTFRYLACNCRAVFIIPSYSPSVRDELRMLIDDRCLEKTLVLMPPATRSLTHMESERQRFGKAWSDVREVLRSEMNLNLPEYEEPGMLYVPNVDFSPKRKQMLDGSLSNIGNSIGQLSPAIENDALPLFKVVEKLKDQGFQQASKRTFVYDDPPTAAG